MRIYQVLLALTLTFSCVVTSAAGTCGKDLTGDSGIIVSPPTDPGPNQTCTWTISNKNNILVMVHFSSLTVQGTDEVAVYAGENITAEPITSFTNSSGPVTVVSLTKVMTVVLTRGSNDTSTVKFSGDYNTKECLVNVNDVVNGVVTSPVYLNGSGEVACTYTVNLPTTPNKGVLSFTKLNLPKGQVTVTFDNGSTSIINGTNLPVDSFGDAGTNTIKLVFSVNVTVAQDFSAMFFTANSDCSGIFSADEKFVLPVTNQFALDCYAQISASTDNEFVSVNINNAGVDTLQFLDGNNTKAPLIGSAVEGGMANWFVSSTKYMTMLASLKPTDVARTTTISFASNNNSRLYNVADTQSVALDAKTMKTSPVQLEFVSTKQLQVVFDADVLTDGSILVQDRNGFRFSFGKQSAFFPVVVPGNHLLLTVTFSGTQTVNATVSVTNGASCNQILSEGASQIAWPQPPANVTQCTKVFYPTKGTTINDMFVNIASVTTCEKNKISVYNGLNDGTALLTFTGSYSSGPRILFPMFHSDMAARFVWDMDPNCKEVPAGNLMTGSYWTQAAELTCKEFNQPLMITTPNFPNQYPLNTYCHQTINTSLPVLYIQFTNFDLNSAHSLTVSQTIEDKTTTVMNLTGSSLPRDFLLSTAGVLSLKFDTTTNMMVNSSYAVSGYGVSASLKNLSCGGYRNVKGGKIIQPPQPPAGTDDVECIWLIKLLPAANESVKNIVSVDLIVTGYTKSSSGSLELRDGNSFRNSPIEFKYMKPNPTILTRTEYLWVRYFIPKPANGAVPSLFNFTLNFKTYPCDKQCDSGTCMHPDWRCDGVNNCGDGSDEFHCNGTGPVKGKSSGVGAFWIPLCLIFGLALGAMIVCVIPRVYRRVRTNNYRNL